MARTVEGFRAEDLAAARVVGAVFPIAAVAAAELGASVKRRVQAVRPPRPVRGTPEPGGARRRGVIVAQIALTDEEACGGLPVITTRQSGAAEIIEDGKQGFVIENPEDINDIAEKITLLMDLAQRQRMSIEARKLAEKFSFKEHMRKIYDLYDSIKKARRSSHL